LANSGIALSLLHPDFTVPDCLSMARESLDSGKALRSFTKLMELNDK
jgi:anthranilate phosphoribosyltransferase